MLRLGSLSLSSSLALVVLYWLAHGVVIAVAVAGCMCVCATVVVVVATVARN